MSLNKSRLIDLDLLNYYDGLIVSKEKEQNNTLANHENRISTNEQTLIEYGNRISTNENRISTNEKSIEDAAEQNNQRFLSIGDRVTNLEKKSIDLFSGNANLSIVQGNDSSNKASSESAIALGRYTEATNIRAIAAGIRTYASRINSFTAGEYSKRNDDAIFIIGGGNDLNSRVNFFEVIKPLNTSLNSPDLKVTILGASIVNDNNFTDEWILDGGSAENIVTLLAVENEDILADNNENQLAIED